jgi:hypothetical protein
MSIALLSLFVSQSILRADMPIPNDLDKEDMLGAATQFTIYAIIAIAAFSVLVLLDALSEFHQIKVPKVTSGFEWTVYCLCWFPIIHAIKAQRSFKLRAS